MPVNIYSDEAVQLFYELLPAVRAQFIQDCAKPELWQGEVMAGCMVKSDGAVLTMLRSWASEDEFIREPLTWTIDAMQACAEIDWVGYNNPSKV
jgi:hypothetical protein